ncbi:hypothetical protein [Mesorhizobium sp. CO1-1-8]|uniref:hypothetical protein n=1 Tax=Mesorhizobium sp. CO1-1-8 TaxID=2876631 RepID=UPI001CD1015B|nr:hypothetical protein [Mesorhizobium sp. CO1-1-8]MBZ9772612.1 hypothetical protein [Mesorhizobium sp. CO1-1-8]
MSRTKLYPSDVGAISEISLWKMADPQVAASAATDLYGSGALTAAAYCALNAHYDGRKRDYQFWHAVFLSLGGDSGQPALSAEAPAPNNERS